MSLCNIGCNRIGGPGILTARMFSYQIIPFLYIVPYDFPYFKSEPVYFEILQF